jgi:signal transduction histidine kinase
LVVGGSHVQDAWMFGVAVGCDATLGARTIGTPRQPWRWWRRVVTGPLHVAVAAVASAVGAWIGGAHGVIAGLAVYATAHFAAFAAALQAWELERIRGRYDDEVRDHVESMERERHRQRAHWLHDDVCSELRLLRLQIETKQIEPHELPDRLDELDHRLRIRQLDELLRSGRVRLAELIQPFVRRAHANGLRVRDVPSFEQASLELDEPTGRMVQRAAAVLMTNSIQAGATEIAIRATVDDDRGRFELEFEDDGGGFDIEAVPAGRGLDSLRHDLPSGALALHRTDTGTVARVVFSLPAPEGAR